MVNRLNYIKADADCRVRVMQASINDSRPAVVDKVISLKRGGCHTWVSVDGIQSRSLAKLKAAGIPEHKSPVHDNTGSTL